MVDNARSLWLMRVDEKKSKIVKLNDVKLAVERKEVLGARFEVAKDRFIEFKKERERLKGVYTQAKGR